MIDPNGKYWVVNRAVSYAAAWRDGSLTPVTEPSFEWEVMEHYAMHPELAYRAPGYETGEEYRWASAITMAHARDIAQAFAAKHGGTVIVDQERVARAVGDPGTYKSEWWLR